MLQALDEIPEPYQKKFRQVLRSLYVADSFSPKEAPALHPVKDSR